MHEMRWGATASYDALTLFRHELIKLSKITSCTSWRGISAVAQEMNVDFRYLSRFGSFKKGKEMVDVRVNTSIRDLRFVTQHVIEIGRMKP